MAATISMTSPSEEKRRPQLQQESSGPAQRKKARCHVPVSAEDKQKRVDARNDAGDSDRDTGGRPSELGALSTEEVCGAWSDQVLACERREHVLPTRTAPATEMA